MVALNGDVELNPFVVVDRRMCNQEHGCHFRPGTSVTPAQSRPRSNLNDRGKLNVAVERVKVGGNVKVEVDDRLEWTSNQSRYSSVVEQDAPRRRVD
ncbi:MAG: hypothetical protein NT062_15035, partial [Proteobacteria bacterium]|nr:hypothetical protein [Pseudomonadota bacterium]